MFRKIVLVFVLILFLGTVCSSSEAFFFKKHKGSNQSVKTVKQIGEKKIILAEIYASWCPGCKNIQPTIDSLIKTFPQVELVQLDVSTPSKAEASQKLAAELMILDFYNAHKSKTATIGVIVPTSGEPVSVFHNENNEELYKAPIQDAQVKEKELNTPPA